MSRGLSDHAKVWGRPSEKIYDDLWQLPHLIKIALLEAAAHPEEADERIAGIVADARRLCETTAHHMRGAVERAERRENAAQQATERAERRIERALADLHEAAVGQEVATWQGYFVYCLWGDDAETPLYVGKSLNFLGRLGTHLADRRKRQLVRRFTLIRCKSEIDMTRNETRLINHYQPPLNIAGIRDRTG